MDERKQLNRVDREYAIQFEHWNIISERLTRNMSQMEDHGLYAAWMLGDLQDLQATYIRLTALRAAGAIVA